MTETITHHEKTLLTPEVIVTRQTEDYPDPLAHNLIKALDEAAEYTQALYQLHEAHEVHRDALMERRLRFKVREDTMINEVIKLEQGLHLAQKHVARQTMEVREKSLRFTSPEQQSIDAMLAVEELPEALTTSKRRAEYHANRPLSWCEWLAKAPDSSVQSFARWHHELLQAEVGEAQKEEITYRYNAFKEGLFQQTVEGALHPKLQENFLAKEQAHVIIGSPFDRMLFQRQGYAKDKNTVVLSPLAHEDIAELLPHELMHLLGGFYIDNPQANEVDLFQEAAVDYLADVACGGSLRGKYPTLRGQFVEVLRRSGVGSKELSYFFAGADKAHNFVELNHSVTHAKRSQVDFAAYVRLWLSNYPTVKPAHTPAI
jgi:hypothetical protein